MKSKKTLTLAIPITIIIFLLVLILVFLPGKNIVPFNSSLWHKFPRYRYSMSNSLVEKINNKHLHQNDIIFLIGQPDYRDDNDSAFTYFLKSNAFIFGLDSYWLDITFKDSTIVTSIYRTD